MTDLDVTTASTTVETGLRDTIALALRRRYPAVADLAALRRQPTLGASGTSNLDDTNVELVPVTAAARVYRWSAPSTEPDDGDAVIAPTDRAAAGLPGRWMRTAASMDAGFLDAVRLYEGEDTEDMILEKVLGAVPSCVVVWRGEDHRLKSVVPGALYEFMVDFEIWVSSKSMRRGNEALVGSPIADEAAFDPGVLNAVGRVKKVLAGSNLGLGDGVDYVQLGGHMPKLQSLSEGQFVHALKIRVKASIHIPDEPGDDFPLDGNPGVLVLHKKLAELGEAPFDPANHRVRGLEVDLGHVAGPSLLSLVHAGEVVIGGRCVAVGETLGEFAPTSDVYRDVFPNGVLWLTAVPIDALPPPRVSGALRVGVSRTNATDVVSDRFLVGSVLTVGEPDLIPPEST